MTGAAGVTQEPLASQEVVDALGAEPLAAFRWPEPFSVDLVGDLFHAHAGLGEGMDPRDQGGVVAELVETGDRTHDLSRAGVPAGPGDADVDLLSVADDRDDDLGDHQPQ